MRQAALMGCIAMIACVSAVRAAPPPMAVKVWVDRTALYPGDRLQYVARVEHSADVEFVQDHVRKDQLSLEPFEILDAGTAAGDLPGGRKFFEVKLLLTTYDAVHPDATVPSFNLFYFRHSEAANSKDTAPAETLSVPGVKIGLRSTMVDLPGTIRDDEPPLPLSGVDWILPAVLGWCGLLGVIAYGSSLGLKWVRSGFWKQKMTQRIRKKSLRESFDEIRQAPVDSPESVETFYSKATTILRGLAGEKLGDCSGLTAREMRVALRESGDSEVHAKAVGDLLEQCDLVRYSADGAQRARGRHPEFLRQFGELIERH